MTHYISIMHLYATKDVKNKFYDLESEFGLQWAIVFEWNKTS